MRLKSIEIKGFKSFGEKTLIHFDENVTGIVGPNGSGKSNIVDAIRWVLGEQKSRELRLDTMSDVLFNGTKKRRAANSAEVTLTFENTKNLLATSYTSVAVTRVLYRNGDSEYKINDVKCRLKDIRNLFLDSGIGSNSYAIIALGMVEDILSDRDKARRTMFEQAAGISKFKVHKAETLSKLKQTEQDLLRLEDLIYEIEDNLKNLEKQARRAKKYLQLKDRYKILSLDYASMSYAKHHAIFEDLKDKIQAERAKEAQLNNQLHEKEARLQEMKARNLHLEKDLSKAQKSINDLVNEIRKSEEEQRKMSDRLDYLRQSTERDQSLYEENILKSQEKQHLLENAKQKTEELAPVLQSKEKEIAALKGRLDLIEQETKDQKQELKEFRAELLAIANQKTAVEKQLALDQAKIVGYRTDIETSREEGLRMEQDVGELIRERSQIEEELQKERKAYEKIQKQIKDVRVREEKLREEREQIKNEIAVLERSFHGAKNEYELLKDLADQLEGFPKSIKYLNAAHQKWTTKPRLLADLIDVDEAYRVALECYLEPYLNCFVVKDRKEALKAITLLADNQKGRAGFLILEDIEKIESKGSQEWPYTRAIDIVDVESDYLALFQSLLANTFIVDNDQEFTAASIHGDCAVLTMDGRILHRKGYMLGGSVGLFEGKRVGRSRQLEKLSKKVAACEKDIQKSAKKLSKIEEGLTQLKTDNSHKKKAESHNDRIRELERDLVRYEAQINGKQDAQRQLNNKITAKEAEIRATEAKVPTNEKVVTTLDKKLVKIQQSIEDLDKTYQGGADQFATLNQNYNSKQIELVRLQSEVKQAETDCTRFLREQAEINQANKAIEKRLLSFKREQSEILERQEDLAKYLNILKLRKGEMDKNLTDVEKGYFEAKANETDIEEEIRVVNKNLRNHHDLVSQLREKFAEVQLEIGKITERARIELGIRSEEIKAHRPEGQKDEAELNNDLQRLKAKIDQFGEVNPMSVEAYDAMNERYTDITEQRDDVLQSKQSLLETIDEIEETVNERFMETFEAVKINFQKVFRTLFTEEDDCDLVLLNPEEKVGSGIEIIAKPKGKRPKSIAQLSGGEKTLTAVALLFALYLHKPAPFCVFDEVDAPLDDTNITKFNNIIREFSNESQFIIITHNKLTMAEVDVIYGVFMQEIGISKVGAVDFRTFEHELEYESIG